jgi:hypothetical protein
VAEVEIVFGEDAGVLSGMKLVGVRIWKSDMGRLFVTLPAKPGKSGATSTTCDPRSPATGRRRPSSTAILREWEAMHAAEASVA